jgi:hypothetical protein
MNRYHNTLQAAKWLFYCLAFNQGWDKIIGYMTVFIIVMSIIRIEDIHHKLMENK